MASHTLRSTGTMLSGLQSLVFVGVAVFLSRMQSIWKSGSTSSAAAVLLRSLE
jgi:hypothetical protein